MPMPWDDPDPLAAFGLDAPQADTLPLPVVPAGRPAAPPSQAPQAPPAGQGDGGGLLKMLLLAAPALMLGTARGGVGAAGAGLSGLTRGYLANREWQAQQQYKQEMLEQRAEAARIARERTLASFTNDVMQRLSEIDDPDQAKQLLEFAEQQYQALGGSPGGLRNLPMPKSTGLTKWQKETQQMLATFEKAQGAETLGRAVAEGWTMARPGSGEQVKVADLIEQSNYGMRDPSGKPVFLPTPPKAGAAFSADAYGNRLERAVAAENAKRQAAGQPPLTDAEINVLDDTLRRSYTRLDDRPPMVIRNESGWTPQQQFQAVRQLRGEAQRETRAMREVGRQVGLMRAAMVEVKAGKKMAGDQAILLIYQKILDPVSVVREGEFARSAMGQDFIGRLEGQWERFIKGGMGVKDLQQFLDIAEQFAKNYEAFYNDYKKQMDEEARIIGVDPSRIMREWYIPQPQAPPPATTGGKPKVVKVERVK